MVNKGEAGQRLREYLTFLERQLEKHPKAVCADNGHEYLNTATETWCKDVGIDLQITAPYSPAQNGVSKRFNQTLMELAWAMRLDANLLSYPYFSQSQLWSNLGLPDLSLGIDATPDLVRPSPAP